MKDAKSPLSDGLPGLDTRNLNLPSGATWADKTTPALGLMTNKFRGVRKAASVRASVRTRIYVVLISCANTPSRPRR